MVDSGSNRACRRRPPNLSGVICPYWSRVGCHHSAPHFTCVFAKLPGGFVSVTFLTWGWGWKSCSFLCLPYFSFWRWGLLFPFSSQWELQWTDMTSQITMGSGSATSSASSLRMSRCISSGPMVLCTFMFLRCSQVWSSPTVGNALFPQSLPVPSVTWVVWLEHSSVNTKAKKSLITSAFSTSWVARSLSCSRDGPHFP